MDILDFDEDAEAGSESDDLLETSRRLTRSTPDLTNMDQVYLSQQQSKTRSRSRSPWSVYPIYRKSKSKDVIGKMDSRPEIVNHDPEFTKPKADYPSDDSGVDINGHTRKAAPAGSRPGLSQQAFLRNSSRVQISQEVTKELSGPQKKILSHLQLRKAQEERQTNFNKISKNRHTEPAKASRSASADKKRFTNLVEHTAEVHESPDYSDNEDSRDISDLRVKDRKPGLSSVPALDDDYISPAPNETSRRPLHRSRLKDKSRSRSRSKPRGIEDFGQVNDGTQTGRVTQSSTVVSVHGDASLSQNNSAFHRSGEHAGGTSKQSSALFNLSLKPRPRKDKSPFTKIWRNFKHNANSNSAVTASDNHEGTLTINGQLISSATTDSDESSASNNQDLPTQEKHHENDVFAFLESNDYLVPLDDVSDSQIGGNTNASKPGTTNHKSKGALLARVRKGSSNETSPIKMGGVSSSRYKSPRRDKQVSRINVPFIKIDHSSNDKADGLSVAPPLGGNVGDVKEGSNFLTVIQHNGLTKDEQKSTARITISDQLVDSRANFRSSIDSISQGRNVTSISVGGVPHQDPAEHSIEAIKRKAKEKYGEIPLDIVYIYRSKPTLGVAIEGGANTRQPLPKVISVQPGGSAFESGGLKVGHVILEVNDQPVVGLSHMDAARLIAEAFKSRSYNRMELLVTEWTDALLDAIKVDVGMLKLR